MMVVNRISHANLAMQQARGLCNILTKLGSAKSFDAQCDALVKEAGSLAENLAITLSARRFFTAKLAESTAENPCYDLDPRFLLFEFSHGILLREAQVDLVRKLLGEMEAGRSICHQMLMGAGKTTVVGPMVAMLLADRSTLMMEVCAFVS